MTKCISHVSFSCVCRFGDAELAYLEGMSSLKELNFSDCTYLTDGGLVSITQWMPRLTCLDLSGCSSLTAGGLRHLSALTSLRSLDIQGCRLLTDNCLLDMTGALPALTKLTPPSAGQHYRV
jgi:Leucine Rich repeat/Leucine Rich Repeat